MQINESWQRDVLRIFIWYPFRWFCAFAPLRVNYAIFNFMGRIHCTIARKRRKRLNDIFQQYLGEFCSEKIRKVIIRDFFCNHYVDRMSIFHYHRFNKKNLSSIITFKGLSHLNESLEAKKGVILVHGHLGPSQLPLIGLGVLGYPVTQMGFRTADGLSNVGKNVQLKIRMRIEEKFPAEMLYVNTFQRQVFRSLEGNRIVMTAGDGSGRKQQFGHYCSMPFLNDSFDFPVGPFKLAEKTAAKLLFLSIHKTSFSSYNVVITSPATHVDNWSAGLEAFSMFVSKEVSRSPGLWHLWEKYS